MMALSVVLSAFVLWERLAQEAYVHRNPLFMIAILLFITGVQMLSVGLLAEIIIRTYFESRGRPAYTVADALGFERAPIVPVQTSEPTVPARTKKRSGSAKKARP